MKLRVRLEVVHTDVMHTNVFQIVSRELSVIEERLQRGRSILSDCGEDMNILYIEKSTGCHKCVDPKEESEHNEQKKK